MPSRFRLLAAATATSAAALLTVSVAEARTVVRVDITVQETFGAPAPAGEVTETGRLDCAGGAVTTSPTLSVLPTDDSSGLFAGTKLFDCGEGDTLTMAYRAVVGDCDSTGSFGWWRVVSGTGDFTGARGAGFLVGSYTGPDGTACADESIADRYLGRLVLP